MPRWPIILALAVCCAWQRILNAIERLHSNAPPLPQGLAKRGAHNSRNCR